MAQSGTINDLVNKNKLDNLGQDNLAARNLRQARRQPRQDDSIDKLVSLAGGIGGMGGGGADGKKKEQTDRQVAGNLRRENPKAARGFQRERETDSGAGQLANITDDLDTRLLASQLREEKNKERERRGKEGEKGEETEKGEKGGEAKEGGGLRDRVSQLKEKANLKKRAKKKIEEKITAPAKQGTNRLLCLAWENLIDSFGATLLYINLHVFLHWVLGEKLFCKLGEEWIPKEAQAVAGEAGKTGGKAIGLVEVMVLLFLDLIVLVIIGGTLALLVMIVDFMGKGFMGKVGAVVSGITTLGWGAVMALFNLFKDL